MYAEINELIDSLQYLACLLNVVRGTVVDIVCYSSACSSIVGVPSFGSSRRRLTGHRQYYPAMSCLYPLYQEKPKTFILSATVI